MSSYATISYEAIDGSVSTINCKWDGYMQGGVGEQLHKYFADEQDVLTLCRAGNIRYLEEGVAHYFTLKSSFDSTRSYTNLQDMFSNEDCAHYLYLYKQAEGCWYVFAWSTRSWHKLSNFFA